VFGHAPPRRLQLAIHIGKPPAPEKQGVHVSTVAGERLMA
jgi:hypothetical protein